ncbi:MAG TPA: dephospho-CoA kinase [Candidatus Atribacteria bacterium]|nr:dephospho-CoA kinase [Candidatus Atribacteria bacterium]
MKIFVGLAGKIASGKTTVANYLKEKYHFEILRFRDIIIEVLEDRGMEVNRMNMQKVGDEIYSLLGPKLFSELLLCKATRENDKYVIDSIRHIKIHLALKEKLDNYVLLFIDSDNDKRNKRLKVRDGENINVHLLENHPVEQEIDYLEEYADYILINNEDVFSLYRKIDKIITQILGGE